MSALPAGWTQASLGDLGEYLNGMAFKPEDWGPKGMPIIRIQNLTNPEKPLNRTTLTADSRYIVEEGDLLISWSATLDAFIWKGERALLNQHIFKVTPSVAADARFLYYLSRSAISELFSSDHLHGSTMKHINRGPFLAHKIGLPPLAEQRRIVAKLDALTARTARARADLDRIPALTARYKQAVLASELNGLTASSGEPRFDRRPLSSVLFSTFYGPRFGSNQYDDEGIPTLRTTDFGEWGDVKPRSPPGVIVSEKEYRKWGLMDGDLLVTRTGSIGKCAVYDAKVGPALPSAYLIRVRLDLTLINPRFALLCLLSNDGQNQLGLGITAVTQPNINASVIERLILPVPALKEQAQIVRRIEIAFAEIDRLAAEAAAARRLLDRLDQAVLAKAFRGDLVPQDPADEPASTLLARLAATRAAAPKARRGRKTVA